MRNCDNELSRAAKENRPFNEFPSEESFFPQDEIFFYVINTFHSKFFDRKSRHFLASTHKVRHIRKKGALVYHFSMLRFLKFSLPVP